MEAYDGIRNTLRELGFDPDKDVHSWGLKGRLTEKLTGANERLAQRLRALTRDVEQVLGIIEPKPGEKVA